MEKIIRKEITKGKKSVHNHLRINLMSDVILR